ncbi:MAG: MFS transporter [Alphaproteobacteria bacterium]|nr:MFS transporter [Alphaproteobacteria bacterium]MBU1515919.1 MFS transporter [Alphaproteobacteria bacterium]MBU2094141.1 MFS transporter [Alphaproteobacteria bacterium]MBU2151493.1 MFS transporter [Alphaproteobacteria bacterium]MBU2305231.1 MFS transporter [Alphaproteobacteria bacterium]
MSPTDEPIDGPVPEAAAPKDSGKVARGWVVPAIIGSALMMQTLNATVITNALPAMARAFDVEPLRLNVAITVYMLSAAIFLPLSGWLADRFGARRVFMCSIVLYAAGSVACGFTQDLWQLVLARFAQGAAGATLAPVGRLVLLRTTPKTELVGAMSVLTMPALLGPVIGPVVGGAIVTFADWRWIFFLNLPVAVTGLFLVWRHVPNVREQQAPRVDIPGIVMTGLGLAALIFGFENLGRDALSPLAVAGLFGLGFASLGLYGWHAGHTPHAVIQLNIFRKATFRASVIGGAFMRVAMGANPFLLAMLLQVAFGMSAFAAGLMTFISAVGALVMKTTAPPILRRFGFRSVLLVNAVIVGVSFIAYSFFRPDWPHWAIMIVLGAGGFFRSLQFTSLNGMAYAEIESEEMSRAATTSSMVQQLVQSIGIGLSASLLHLLMTLQGRTRLTVEVVSPAFIVVGLVTMISMFWFIRLPADAGDEMNGRKPA